MLQLPIVYVCCSAHSNYCVLVLKGTMQYERQNSLYDHACAMLQKDFITVTIRYTINAVSLLGNMF